MSAKILLKARPTALQIADRFAQPSPDGLELYLDAADIRDEGWLECIVAITKAGRPEPFEFVVEGPLRSLDGAFFDATVFNEPNRTVLDRLVEVGRGIGAKAAVIHAMAARTSALGFDTFSRLDALEQAILLFRYYAERCLDAGIVPTVENVPPVARMREGSYMYSHIGTMPGDIQYLVDHVPGLRVTIDVSHAQLYVNAYSTNIGDVDPELQPIAAFIQEQDGVDTLGQYIGRVESHLHEAHISNATGMLGEGLPYGDGDLDLDAVVRKLDPLVAFLVTETLEPDPNHAVLMREAYSRMALALQLPSAKDR